MTEFCHLLFVYQMLKRLVRENAVFSCMILFDQIQEFVAGAFVAEEDAAEG